jgi:phage terminase large subunit
MQETVIDFSYDQLPGQKYLSDSEAQFKAMFGGFGSGKTEWLCREVLRYSTDYDNNYFVVLRQTYPELDDTVWKEMKRIIPPQLIKRHEKTKRDIELINGSMIVGRSFDALSKIFSYNLGGFAVDQAEEIPEEYFLAFTSRLRKAGIPTTHGLLSLNPAGHNWVWRRFIRDTPIVDKGKENDYYIAKTEENIHLPHGYVDMLRRVFPAKWVSRYVDCEFGEFEGLVFDKFKDKNIISGLTKHPRDVEHIFVSIDVGLDNPCAVLFSYFDKERCDLVPFDLIYRSGLTPFKISAMIKAKLRKWKISYVYKYLIDPDGKKRQQAGKKTVEEIMSVAKDFRSNGIPVQYANNNVDYGILRTNEFCERNILKVYNGQKMTPFFDEIYDYVYKMPKAVLKGETNSPGKPLNKKNHIMDVLRYTVMEIPLAWTDAKRSEIDSIWMRHFAKRFKTRKRTASLVKHARQKSIHATPDIGLSNRPMGKMVKRR